MILKKPARDIKRVKSEKKYEKNTFSTISLGEGTDVPDHFLRGGAGGGPGLGPTTSGTPLVIMMKNHL